MNNKINIIRTQYLNELQSWKDKHIIKVVTGVRRSGKSTILKQFETILRSNHNGKINIISFDFSDNKLSKMSEEQLHDRIIKLSKKSIMNYVLLDEVQEISNFEKAVISLFEHKTLKFDLYITGSNSRMFSSELATLFTGRNIDISVFPLSFKEYYEYVKDVSKIDRNQIFENYLRNGGMPITLEYLYDEHQINQVLLSVCKDIIEKDIKKRHNFFKRNEDEFNAVVKYTFQSVGQILSTHNIEKYLRNVNKSKVSRKTIENYLLWLRESLLAYRVNFYNTVGKRVLNTSGKYYSVDTGIRNAQHESTNLLNRGSLLENIVYIELLRRKYKVAIGKLYDGREIDFVATKPKEVIYIQVTEGLFGNQKILDRELGNLRTIKDNYPKILLSLTDYTTTSEDGIKIINLVDWLLGVKS